ncbi:A24 family peptidase [Janthinobacterium psychrotolerans]|uniref:Prepilin peptidase CpaA n=1 Tax=Janthinobacterium psychrotolerans TaxID=1747903 RepID=A0A1A7BXU1_9BURK|nr:A24 family peptidase [Janthinobacterium psychrotolerans]OBV37305.1 prepilin peptidase CpaA [Janthinobacterium psychrotolerans]
MSASVLRELLLLVFVTAAAVSDLMHRKIPNRLLLAGLLAAFCLQGWLAAPAWLLHSLGGMATGFFLFLPLYLLRGMAAGDVKLIAMVGAFAGPWPTLLICFATFVLGGLMALLIVTWQGSWRACWRNLRQLLWPLMVRTAGMPPAPPSGQQASVGNMPYGLAIALGSLLIQGRNYC